jgi:hypothetical protein
VETLDWGTTGTAVSRPPPAGAFIQAYCGGDGHCTSTTKIVLLSVETVFSGMKHCYPSDQGKLSPLLYLFIGLDLLLCSECIFAGWNEGDGVGAPLLATIEALTTRQTTLLLAFEERGGLGGKSPPPHPTQRAAISLDLLAYPSASFLQMLERHFVLLDASEAMGDFKCNLQTQTLPQCFFAWRKNIPETGP